MITYDPVRNQSVGFLGNPTLFAAFMLSFCFLYFEERILFFSLRSYCGVLLAQSPPPFFCLLGGKLFCAALPRGKFFFSSVRPSGWCGLCFLYLLNGKLSGAALPRRKFFFSSVRPSGRGGPFLSWRKERKQRFAKGESFDSLPLGTPTQRPKALPLETERSSRSGSVFTHRHSLRVRRVRKESFHVCS